MRHTNHMKATIWTPTMRADCEGTPDAVISTAFCALDTAERREQCIAKLQATHARMTKMAEREGLNREGLT